MLIDDRLTGVRTRIAEVAAVRPRETACGIIASEHLVLIRLDTVHGVWGHSYLRCYTPRAAKALCTALQASADLVLGSIIDPEQISAVLHREFALLGTKGLIGMAISGLDMAAWDAIAIARGKPLWELLERGSCLPRPYKTLGSMDPHDAAPEAEQAVKSGFGGVKLKAGHTTSEADVAAAASIRSAIGPEPALMIDYNQALGFEDALDRVQRLQAFAIEWIEEPMNTDDHQSYARLRQVSPVPLQIGENLHTPAEIADCLAGADVISFDAGRIGGVTGWLAAETLLQTPQRGLTNHAYLEVAAQLLPRNGCRSWIQWDENILPLIDHPVERVGGTIRLPREPGIGLRWGDVAGVASP